MFRTAILFALLTQVFGFIPSAQIKSSTTLNVKSKSVPFLEQPAALDGKSAGDVGFDPLGLTALWGDKDWSQQVVPEFWLESSARTPISTFYWMKDAEIKHGRIAMLAVLGWVAVDAGVRFPGSPYGSIRDSLSAHTEAVANGSLGVLLVLVSILELASGAAIYDAAKGSGRQPGEFSFDPLGFSKDAKAKERYATSEIKNGRTAMLAFAGIVTQAALYPEKSFPFL